MNKRSNKGNETKKLIPLNDHVFKRMFGEKGRELQLIVLFNGLILRTGEKAVKHITIEEKEIPRELYNDKEIRLDVLATTDKGERINIESQLRNVDMTTRGMFYIARNLVKSVKKGQDYDKMNKVIMVTIFGSRSKERDKDEEYYKYEKSNEYIEIYEFDMSKFDKIKNKDINNPRHGCLMFLSDKTDEKMRKKVIEMEPGLAKAQEIMDYINSSPEEIELYENREITRMDIKNARKRDKEEGKEEEKIEIALNSIKENLPIKTISKITGLPAQNIQELKKEYENNE